MFKRPGDPDEHLQLYAIPAATLLGSYAVGQSMGLQEVSSMAYLAASGEIACATRRLFCSLSLCWPTASAGAQTLSPP